MALPDQPFVDVLALEHDDAEKPDVAVLAVNVDAHLAPSDATNQLALHALALDEPVAVTMPRELTPLGSIQAEEADLHPVDPPKRG